MMQLLKERLKNRIGFRGNDLEKMAQAVKLGVPRETGGGGVVYISDYSGETVSYPITALALNKTGYSLHAFRGTFHYFPMPREREGGGKTEEEVRLICGRKMNSSNSFLKVTLLLASLQWHTEKKLANSLPLGQLN